MRNKGFTLIELLMVIVITGILAGAVTVFLGPAIQSYLDTRRRAELSDMADTALRRMAQDIRSAVPNSIIPRGAGCFQLVPTIAGGRYRKIIDTALPIVGASVALDTSTTTASFDVLNLMRTIPVPGDWVVVNNQNGNDVYANLNRAQIINVQTPPVPGGVVAGRHRIVINPTQFSPGYDGGRFVVVPNASQTIFYSQVGNSLMRTVAGFNTLPAAGCAGVGVGVVSSALVANNVAAATFTYNANPGATQESGYLQMQLDLASQGDAVTLIYGVHVENTP